MTTEPTDSIKEHWKSQEFSDTRSYTHMPYPKWIAETGQNWFRDATIAVLRDRTRDAHPFERVVDLGCSVGDWTLQYLDFSESVTGVDINESFIEQARANAAAIGAEDRADFHVHDIATWRDFDNAGLVTIGAVLTCLDARDNDTLLGRVGRAQRAGDYLYVRATVLNPGREPFTTEGGHYRPKSYYRQLFRRHGYEMEFETYSTSLATSGALVRAGLGHTLSRGALLGLNSAVMAGRFVKRDLDYCNWLLRRS